MKQHRILAHFPLGHDPSRLSQPWIDHNADGNWQDKVDKFGFEPMINIGLDKLRDYLILNPSRGELVNKEDVGELEVLRRSVHPKVDAVFAPLAEEVKFLNPFKGIEDVNWAIDPGTTDHGASLYIYK